MSQQEGWFWQNPLSTANQLNAVQYVSQTDVWAVGEAGTIIKSTDGGNTWEVKSFGDKLKFRDIFFVDANNGTVVGYIPEGKYYGIIMRTTNGGLSWTSQSLVSHSLYSVCFSDINNGIAVGSRIHRTSDGGITWMNDISELGGGDDVTFTDVHNGYIVQSRRILKTTNGGADWTVCFDAQLLDDLIRLQAISFSDLNNGIVVGSAGGSGIIFRTTDGGTTWTQQFNAMFSRSLKGVKMIDKNNIIVTGDYNTILITQDGGTTWWTIQKDENYTIFNAVASYDDNHSIVVGENGSIRRTSDGGTTWTKQPSVIVESGALESVSFPDNNHGYVAGFYSGLIYRTTDGGTTWSSHSTGLHLVSKLSFTDKNTGVVIGILEPLYLNDILKTTDGGITWSSQYSISAGKIGRLRNLCIIDSMNVVVVGEAGYILRTTDGGINWNFQTSGTRNLLYDVSFSDIDNGTVVGEGGIILKTIDGGNHWNTQVSGTIENLYGVSFTSANYGTIVGRSGIILHTTDGGISWIQQVPPVRTSFYDVCFTDENNGVAVGHFGTILKTTDGGNNWYSQSSGTLNQLTCVSFSDKNTGTVVGWWSTILRTTNGGVTFVKENNNITLPENYVLSQNFPNPFNPETTLEYSIPHSGFTSLIVYDILGKEVARLVNEEKSQGAYQVTFNGKNLASGVYFYQIQSGNFVDTKKMILLK